MYDVFKMTCNTTGKSYVGMTTKGMTSEANNIFSLAERGGYNRVADHMVYDICKHGRSDFVVELIKSCETSEDAKAVRAEQIEALNCREACGYNARRARGIDPNSIEVELTPAVKKLAELGAGMSEVKACAIIFNEHPGWLRLYYDRYNRFSELFRDNAEQLTMEEACALFKCNEQQINDMQWFYNTVNKDNQQDLVSLLKS